MEMFNDCTCKGGGRTEETCFGIIVNAQASSSVHIIVAIDQLQGSCLRDGNAERKNY